MASYLLSTLCLVSYFSFVSSVLQTGQLDVYLGDYPAKSSSPSYTMLVSQAEFGSYPSMEINQNPVLFLNKSPSDNELLCQNITTETQGNKNYYYNDNTVVLVPRGTCSFETKAFHAQQLGAKAVLVYGTLNSRYSINETTKQLIFPHEFYDYDCNKGRATLPEHSIVLPYNAEQNDPLLSGDTYNNLCLKYDPIHLRNCPSKACLVTGRNATNGMEVCCAWDLHMWLGADSLFNVTQVTIPAAYLTLQQATTLLRDLQEYKTVQVVYSARWRPSYNLSSFLIWALGVAVAATASYLSAHDYHKRIRKIQTKRPERTMRQQASSSIPARRPVTPEDVSMELTAMHALGFIVMASTSLLILFYFEIYGVVKVLYAFGCSKAVSQVLFYPLIRCCQHTMELPNQIVWKTGTEEFGDLTVRDIVSHVMGYALGMVWLYVAFTVRHPEDMTFFWLTQDVFGAAMCIMFLQVIKLNSIRVATILLIVAFIYDIFFVFISPLLFKKSVMITVATSGGPPKADPSWCEKYPDDHDCRGGDPLPMLLTIPRFDDYAGGSSLLGLGDIVLPGLLLSFGARFDAAKSLLGLLGGGNGSITSSACPERKYCGDCRLCSGGYLLPLIIAYAIGLLMANAAVYIMNMGQPALLYLVPCTLGTMTCMGWRRHELHDLWDGPKAIRAADNIVYGESDQREPGHEPLPVEDGADAPIAPSAEDEHEIS